MTRHSEKKKKIKKKLGFGPWQATGVARPPPDRRPKWGGSATPKAKWEWFRTPPKRAFVAQSHP
jgi:hypothetical protein